VPHVLNVYLKAYYPREFRTRQRPDKLQIPSHGPETHPHITPTYRYTNCEAIKAVF